jgi:starvation-inducible DNA-binding protein
VDIRLHLVQVINDTLACITNLRLEVKKVFWNIKGQSSLAFRALLEGIVVELDGYADQLADRIAVLGGDTEVGAVPSGLGGNLGATTDGGRHIVVLAESFARCCKSVRNAISQALDVEDAVTAALFTEISQGIDSRLCCLESYLS